MEGWLEKAWSLLGSRWKEIVLVAAAVVIVIAVVWIVVSYMENKRLMGEVEYYEIMKIGDEAARVTALEGFIRGHEGEAVSLLGRMWLGSYYDGKGDKEKAAGYYNEVIQASTGKPICYVAIDALAPVYVDMGRGGEAADLYLKIAVLDSNPDPYLSRFKAASIYEVAGDPAKAEEIYKGLIGDEKTPEKIRYKTEEQLLWMEASGD